MFYGSKTKLLNPGKLNGNEFSFSCGASARIKQNFGNWDIPVFFSFNYCPCNYRHKSCRQKLKTRARKEKRNLRTLINPDSAHTDQTVFMPSFYPLDA